MVKYKLSKGDNYDGNDTKAGYTSSLWANLQKAQSKFVEKVWAHKVLTSNGSGTEKIKRWSQTTVSHLLIYKNQKRNKW